MGNDLKTWNESWRQRFPNGFITRQTENNGYHDSYFYETIYDADNRTWESVPTGSTAGWTPDQSTNLPWLRNAPQEIRDQAVQAKRDQTYAYLLGNISNEVSYWIENQEIEARLPRLWDTVRTTRKVKETPKGTVGTVTWKGVDSFSGCPRYGVTNDGERFYINAKSLEIVERGLKTPEVIYEPNENGINNLAKEYSNLVTERHIYDSRVAFSLDMTEIARRIQTLVQVQQ